MLGDQGYLRPVVGGDFNDIPTEARLNPIYLPAYGYGATGSLAEVEADRTPPDVVTRDSRQIDYIFHFAGFVPTANWAGHSAYSDHKVYHGDLLIRE